MASSSGFICHRESRGFILPMICTLQTTCILRNRKETESVLMAVIRIVSIPIFSQRPLQNCRLGHPRMTSGLYRAMTRITATSSRTISLYTARARMIFRRSLTISCQKSEELYTDHFKLQCREIHVLRLVMR